MANSKHVVYKSDGPHMEGAVRVDAGSGPGGSCAGQSSLPAGNGTSPVPVGVGGNVSQPSQLGNAVMGSMPAVNQVNVSVNPDGTIGTSVEVADATPVTGPGASFRSSSPTSNAGEVGVQTGWVKVQNGYKYYFIDESGNTRCKTGWHYEINPDGTKAWYYLDEDPLNKEWMVTGWKKITGPKGTYWYYFRPDGKMSIYWEWLNGLWYYLEPQDDNGNMTIGWREINGEWYYFIPDEDAGYMMIGWLEIKGKWYYFYNSDDKRGIMAANHMVDHTDGKKYYLGTDGAMVVLITFRSAENGKTYTADENGVCIEVKGGNQTNDKAEFGNISGFKQRYGELITDLANEIGVDSNLLGAVIFVESNGRGFINGRLLIRFENHKFVEKAGYQEYFTYNKNKKTSGHKFRKNTNDSNWKNVHTNQDTEYEAFEFAKSLQKTVAYESISMGLGQVMGFNHSMINYDSAEAMFEDFSTGNTRQIVGMVEFIKNNRNGSTLKALQNGDVYTFASHYNGAGNAQVYKTKIIEAQNIYDLA